MQDSQQVDEGTRAASLRLLQALQLILCEPFSHALTAQAYCAKTLLLQNLLIDRVFRDNARCLSCTWRTALLYGAAITSWSPPQRTGAACRLCGDEESMHKQSQSQNR